MIWRPANPGVNRRQRRTISALIACAGGFIVPAEACHAQIAAGVTFYTNETFRGETVSDDAPSVSAQVSLDAGGFFAGASASVTSGRGEARLASATQYVGYAHRMDRTSLEFGVIHRDYGRIVDDEYRKDFFEGYVGISHRTVKARFYVSPDYREGNRASYYAEIDATLVRAGKWSLDAHGGLSLIPKPGALRGGGCCRYTIHRFQDWRVQVSTPVASFFISAGVTGTNYPVYSANGRTRVFASFNTSF